VSQNGQIVSLDCSRLKVRPIGVGTVFPPVIGSPSPSGYHIEFGLGETGSLLIEATNEENLVSQETYSRWTGKLVGGVESGMQYIGISVYEQFTFMPRS